ncbi:hypothetical protein ES332_A08G174700v1 [Gossypium tomentosum]|uniref:Uncharacterized protein n=1 Tax=Gossypium tomentosum TaxID=34277 RepID=A0A5D2PJ92_GOSTO|nr:hypothetical protein ES332_A08G174700v1 [Gossypium tomentosum]TYI15265.1 hypothetical protein ES332_A08G174700v1 [Gossypium tomentosum]
MTFTSPLFLVLFWVQIHDMLIDFQWQNNLRIFLGTFVYYDPKSIIQGIKGFMRTSGCLDVRIRLKNHKKIHSTPDRWVYACFMYESLSLFCFFVWKVGS